MVFVPIQFCGWGALGRKEGGGQAYVGHTGETRVDFNHVKVFNFFS